MTRRRPARRRLLGRLRLVAQGWVWCAILLGVLGLVFSSVQTHRIDSLRVLRVQLGEELELARFELDHARRNYERHADYDVVAARARTELGLVENGTEEPMFLALPSFDRGEDDGGAWARLARTFDRIGEIDRALAKEER